MSELDHIFIACQSGAVERCGLPGDTLARAEAGTRQLGMLGFSAGSPNAHPGQGTSNFRFFIHRFMLEFLYVDDLQALAEPCAAVLALEERFSSADASPFGICSRRDGTLDSSAPFPYVGYHPNYLPAPLHVQVASYPNTTEPLWFHLPFVKSAAEMADPDDSEPRNHANGATRLTACLIESPTVWSVESASVASQLGIALAVGERHCLHLTFDGGHRDTLVLPEEMNLSITL